VKFVRKTTLVGLLIAALAIIALTGRASAQIVAIGGSNTEGTGVSSSEAWPTQLEAMLRAKGKSYTITNRGVYGSKTAEVLARLDSDVPVGTKIVVSMVFKANDLRAGGSAEQGEANKRAITTHLRARGIRVIDARPFFAEAARKGMLQADKIHLTAEGDRYVASHVAALIN
jgi:acyl-CoA thioesterase I